MDTNTRDNESGIDSESVGEVYRTWTDPDESVSVAVADLVGDALGRDPIDLPPINNLIDADALEALFRGPTRRPASVRGLVEFHYLDCQVRVYSDGEVVVKPDDRS